MVFAALYHTSVSAWCVIDLINLIIIYRSALTLFGESLGIWWMTVCLVWWCATSNKVDIDLSRNREALDEVHVTELLHCEWKSWWLWAACVTLHPVIVI